MLWFWKKNLFFFQKQNLYTLFHANWTTFNLMETIWESLYAHLSDHMLKNIQCQMTPFKAQGSH